MASDEFTHTGSISDEPEPVVGFPTKEPSLVDMFKADFDELAQHEEVYIPVQGYERTRLQVKYHLPETGKSLDAIARKVMREVKDDYSRNLLTAIDTMIFLCDGLYAEPDGTLLPFDTKEFPGEPVRFDETLAEMLDLKAATAREVVRRVFRGNDMAILNHAEKLNRWLQNTKADITREFWQQGE